MYSIYGKILGMAMAALWMVFTPTPHTPPTTTTSYPTQPSPPAAYTALWSQSEKPARGDLHVPEALVNALFMEERSRETPDLRMPEALLEYLYSAGQMSGLEKSPVP
jgi:hypothetical protein